ncbi:MAG: methyltransferase, partial [Gammaproteobacteria bacterium]
MTGPPPSSALFHKREALLRLACAVRETGYHFVTVSPATHARVNARPDARQAKDPRGVLGWSQPFRPSALSPSIFSLMQEADVLRPHGDGWRSLIRFSTLHGALFAHSAYPTEAADAVFFGPDTYRFALAIEAQLAQREEPVRRAVDVGCGAGVGAILVARAHPGAEVRAGDVNGAALRLTEVNAALAGTPNVTVCESDVLAGVEGRFDLIVSNPPFVPGPARV